MSPNKEGSFSQKLKSTFREHGLSIQIIVPFLLLIAVTIAFLSLIFYQYNINDMEQLSIRNTRRQLSEINHSIDSYIDNMKSMGQVVVDNHDVRYLLSFYSKYKDQVLTQEQEAELEQLIFRAATHMGIVANTREEITNIAIIPIHGEPVLSNRRKQINPYARYRSADWFIQPLLRQDTTHVSPSHVQNLIAGEYRWVISISEIITDPVTGEITGVMLIDLNYEAIENIFENAQISKGGYLYLLDEKGGIISHPQQQLIYSGIKAEPIPTLLAQSPDEPLQENSTIYLRNVSEVTGWSTVGVINLEELLGNRLEISVFYLLVAISTLLFSTIIAMVISESVTKPIRRLQETMDKARTGDLAVRADISTKNEVGQLADSFNTMISQIHTLMEEAIVVEKEKRDSEIQALQAQINPHFLYNTLDTIIWMAASGKNQDVMDVTSALAHLFRTSISQGDNFVPVATEITNVENYLIIQKMRYKDKLTYEINVEEGVSQLYTPKLILQPIIENALYHGIKPSPTAGTIWISIYTKGDSLIFKVEDNGVGMSPRQISNLLDREKSTGGIGIINVNKRITLLFGNEYGVRYYQGDKKGTIAEIHLPITKEDSGYA